MSELISLDELGVKPVDEETALSLTKTGDYLPQIRVYGSSNDIVKEGNFPMGHFGLYKNKDNIEDLGEQFDALNITARPRAGIVAGEKPISFYDMESAEFKDMYNRAMNKEQGYMAGLEYLLWLPTFECFGLFWMGNPTLRRESEKVKALVGHGISCR